MRQALKLTGVLIAGGVLAAAAADAPIAFRQIKPGLWQLRTLDGSAPPRRICLKDPAELIQMRHSGASCARFVVTNEANLAAIQYRCQGAGYGRTTIKVETGTLLRIESQGLAGKFPFLLDMEARRVGECAPNTASR